LYKSVLSPSAVFFNHRGRGYRKFFAAFGGFFLTAEEGRLREVFSAFGGCLTTEEGRLREEKNLP
jgi:hypothetical protein